jgi:hypothetical protein
MLSQVTQHSAIFQPSTRNAAPNQTALCAPTAEIGPLPPAAWIPSVKFDPLDRHRILATPIGYLSSQTSSTRQPLNMLLTIRVSPFTCGWRHVPSRL